MNEKFDQDINDQKQSWIENIKGLFIFQEEKHNFIFLFGQQQRCFSLSRGVMAAWLMKTDLPQNVQPKRERVRKAVCAGVWARVSERERERVRELNHSEEKERGSINRTPYAHYCHGVIALFTTCYGGRQKKNNLFVSSSQPNHKQCIRSSFLLHVLTLLQCFTSIWKYCLFVLD